MRILFQASILLILVGSAIAQDIPLQQRSSDFPLSTDSLKDEGEPLAVLHGDLYGYQAREADPAFNQYITKIPKPLSDVNAIVQLIPGGEIKTSYSGKKENDTIFLLKRAINRTQLQYKSESEYRPVSAQQTVDRIQAYLAQTVQNRLTACDVSSELPNEDPKAGTQEGQAELNNSKTPDYLKSVELGVTSLVLSKSLFGTTLMGEAEASVYEKKERTKRIWVDTFGGKVTLEKFGSQDAESDVELKSATSKVVEFLGKKLGEKLCNYFN